MDVSYQVFDHLVDHCTISNFNNEYSVNALPTMMQTEKQEFHDEQGGHYIFLKNSRTIQEHFVTFQEHN